MLKPNTKSAAVIVAHPDDETLWAGGTILNHPEWSFNIITICRGDDTDRAPKFNKVLGILNAQGRMADLDDGPEQKPLENSLVKETILKLLPSHQFDLIISHNPSGEYTRHLRHEEVARAVISLWNEGRLTADMLWTFAYEDGGREYYPRPVTKADIYNCLPRPVWLRKYQIITDIYGFEQNGFEAETTPHAEAFWQFKIPGDALKWLNNGGVSI